MPLLTKDYSSVDEFIINQNFSGAILCVQNGNIKFKKTIGYASEKLTSNIETIFNIGSITKQFTAMAILILHEQGKLNLNNLVSTLIADYKHGLQISIKHLLSHTAGIPNYTSIFSACELKNVDTPKELICMFSSLDLDFQPGTEFRYSNSGYALLGYIIELVSGLSYGEFVQTQIFTPLGMKRSGEIHSCHHSNRATGYCLDGKPIETPNKFVPYSAGGLFSTVEDLLLWDQSLYSNQLINKETMELMFTPLVDGYALGWRLSQKFKSVFFHGGSISGFSSFYLRKPLEQKSIICLSNIEGFPIAELVSGIDDLITSKS